MDEWKLEHWKSIEGHVGYQVSSEGRVKRMGYVKQYDDGSCEIHSETILSTHQEPDGLHVNFHSRNHSVHRLVAEAFLDTPNKPCYVQFRDGNKYNCALDNIYYVTVSECIKSAIQSGKRKAPETYKGMPIKCIETSQTWPSIQALSSDIDVSRAVVTRRIRNNQPIKTLHYQFL